jgi:hypothetical protein
MNRKRNYLNRYNRARRVMKRERTRGNKLVNSVGPADVLLEEVFSDWNPENVVYIKPWWVATPSKRRKFRRDRRQMKMVARVDSVI